MSQTCCYFSEQPDKLLLPSAAFVQGHISSFVIKRSEKSFLLVIQTGAGFTVMDQDVAHKLHLPFLKP